ncbi:MAG TPA: chemotaxis protein CheA [Rhodocyclaceae bacterium]|nr:chemotaxis protein CheA [Rhodocyclaceae bacterium]
MTDQDKMQQALNSFMEEARELIAQMESILLAAEDGQCEAEDLNALFRCAHTIKGSAGLFGLDEVVRFTHVVENVLVRLRNGEIGFTPDLVSVLLDCQDHIAGLIEAIADGGEQAVARSDQLMRALEPWFDEGKKKGPAKSGKVVTVVEQDEGQVSATATETLGADHWHLSLRFADHVLTDGMDPLSFINYLAQLGRIVYVETLTNALPPFDEADPEKFYLGFEVALESTASKAEIESVFEFVAESSRIIIIPPHSKIGEYLALLESMPKGDGRLGEILVACGTLTERELEEALAEQARRETPSRLGEVLIDQGVVPPEIVEAAAEKQKKNEDRRSMESKTVKVPSDRLDALIDRVGELVIAGAGTQTQVNKINQPHLQESVSVLVSLVEDIRDMVLGLRMVAIGEVFARFPRVVRDVSKQLGKEIELKISGADSELDKSMIEKIADPLMHLVRNSMDHGIESADLRLARGKPACGTVELNAYHESGLIIVEVKDDGGGLDPAKILKKAIAKGIVAPGVSLTEPEILRLILEAGFSTAEQVSDLSGRGVGMDVVRSNVEAMRGTLDIQSELGKGTTMRLCLPLTLAIIDGFHVGVGDAQFIVPLDMVVECIELPPDAGNSDFIELREEALPIIRLRRLFNEQGAAHPRPRIVVVRFAGKRAGLVVDRMYGKCQTVIKPLGPLFEHVPCVSGSTILGDGEVALIIDVAQLIANVVSRTHHAARPALSAA